MPLNKEAKSLIAYHVSRKRESYSKLNRSEKVELISCIIKNLDKYDKAGVISDNDPENRIPDLIAEVIYREASFDSVKKLIDEIMQRFVFAPMWELTIDEYFDDEWVEQWPTPNEHFEHDARERARAAQWGAEC